MPLLQRLRNAFRRSRIDAELREEIETHLALLADAERAHGATPAEARARARARFGGALTYREGAVDAAMATWLETTGKELVFAARRLVRSPAFTLASILTLALALGANVAIFSVVERVVLNPLPYPDSDRIVQIDHGSERLHVPAGFGFTPGVYYEYTERSRTLEHLAIYQTDDATLTGAGEPVRIRVAAVTPSLIGVTRVPPAFGRWFTDQEGVPGAARVALVSSGLWTRRFNRDRGIVGRTVLVGGLPIQIVGVMPSSFAFPDARVDLWTPLQLARARGFGLWGYQGVARLRDGADVDEVRRELPGLIADLPRAFPGDPFAIGNVETNLIVSVVTLKEAVVGGVARALWILLAAVAVVLLIASANVANLFLVRSDVRQREVAIRAALGAGRMAVARFFFTESAWLSAAGGAAGFAIAAAAVRLLVRLGPSTLPRLAEVRLDGLAVGVAIALSVFTAVLFGVVPIWRGGAALSALRDSGRSHTTTRSRQKTRHLLMGAQVALALVLLVAAGLTLRSFQNLRALDPGFDPRSALTFTIGLPDRDYPDRERAVAAHRAILDGLSALPGVSGASAATCLPLAGGCFGNTVRVRGRVMAPDAVPPIALFRGVAAGYFEVMGMRIVQGRAIEREDVERRGPIVVVDRTFADQFFPNEEALGRYVASNRAPRREGEAPEYTWLQIVGVVAATPTRTLVDAHPLPQLYMPMSIAAGPGTPTSALVGPNIAAMSYVVRSIAPRGDLLPAVRRVVDAVDANLAVAQVQSLQEILDRSSAQMGFTMALLAIAAIVALLLGIVGIYGVTSYLVTQRTSEIGVRLALGAEPRGVTRMIVGQGALVAAAGLAAGLVAALSGGRLIESLLYGVTARDPAVLAATAAALLVVAVVACWVPARRAARLNPIEALRE